MFGSCYWGVCAEFSLCLLGSQRGWAAAREKPNEWGPRVNLRSFDTKLIVRRKLNLWHLPVAKFMCASYTTFPVFLFSINSSQFVSRERIAKWIWYANKPHRRGRGLESGAFWFGGIRETRFGEGEMEFGMGRSEDKICIAMELKKGSFRSLLKTKAYKRSRTDIKNYLIYITLN